MATFTESEVEAAALEWLEDLGWTGGPRSRHCSARVGRGTNGLPRSRSGTAAADALDRLNPALPADALDDAFRKLTRPTAPRWKPATAHSTACSWTA